LGRTYHTVKKTSFPFHASEASTKRDYAAEIFTNLYLIRYLVLLWHFGLFKILLFQSSATRLPLRNPRSEKTSKMVFFLFLVRRSRTKNKKNTPTPLPRRLFAKRKQSGLVTLNPMPTKILECQSRIRFFFVIWRMWSTGKKKKSTN